MERSEVESLICEAVEELLEALDAELDEDVSTQTMLVDDAEFSSIDFVQLIVSIEEKLGRKVGFQDMLMRDGSYVEDLSIGEVVDFTMGRLNAPKSESAGAVSAPATATTTKVAAPEIDPSTKITEADVSQFVGLIKPRRILPVDHSLAKNKRAVFILSPPRSGSTLLRVMVAGNPSLFAPPELHLLSYATMPERRADLNSDEGEQLLDGAVRALMQTRGCTAEQARELIAECESKNMGTQEFFGILQENLGDRLLVEKTPTYAFSVDILRQAEEYFEDPLYIHLLRHPCGMIRSYEESNLTRMMPLMMKSSEFSTAAVAEMIWLLSNRNILEFSKAVPEERWFSVSYENIVNGPEAEMQRLCEFLGVAYHTDMVNPYSDNKARMTDGVDSASKMSGDLKFHLHSQIDPAAATRWQQFCSEDMLGEPTKALVQKLNTEVARIRV